MTIPSHLSNESTDLWNSITERFVLDPEHLSVLAETLTARDRADEARQRLTQDGTYITGARGGLVAHPAVAVERDARIAFLRGMRQLGLDEFTAPKPHNRDGRGRFARP